MPIEFSMPLARRDISDDMINKAVAILRSSGILLHRDRPSLEADYFFRVYLQTEPVDSDENDEENVQTEPVASEDEAVKKDYLQYEALLFMSHTDNEIRVFSAARMEMISLGRFIGADDKDRAIAIKIPDEYRVWIPETEKDAIRFAEECLELFFIWLERKPPQEGNTFVTVSRSPFYDDIKIMDKDRTYCDVYQPWWFRKRSN